jgi:hypothetical protein
MVLRVLLASDHYVRNGKGLPQSRWTQMRSQDNSLQSLSHANHFPAKQRTCLNRTFRQVHRTNSESKQECKHT